MPKKKVYHLKKNVKIFILVIIVIAILSGIIFSFVSKIVKEKNYKNSNEYKLLELGYKEEDVKNILKKLKDDEVKEIIDKYEYDEFIPEFIKCKYFMYEYLDEYLSLVIYQKDDFFKYHGTEGYDYNNLVSIANSNANKVAYENDLQVDLSKNNAIIVNKYYRLNSDYVPSDLVDIELKYYYGEKKQIKKEVYDAYINMFNDAKEAGFYLVILSAYKSYESQEAAYNKILNKHGVSYADNQVTRAGYSEHQSGLALDIYSKDCTNAKTFNQTQAYEWLINNSYKYGFILRYPDGVKKITGFNYEAGHFRYVGVDLAKKIKDSNLTFEEYYAFYIK